MKRWRNDRAKADGKPAYAIARNIQLAEIVIKAPKSLAALKEIAGLGEAFCRDYGPAVLELVKTLPEPMQDGKPQHEERESLEGTDVRR